MSSRAYITLVAAISLVCVTSSTMAAKAPDRAAFTQSIAVLASEISIPKPIAHLVTVGEFYCEMKKAAGKAPNIYAAYAEYRKSHSSETPDHDLLVTERAAMDEASRSLCPE